MNYDHPNYRTLKAQHAASGLDNRASAQQAFRQMQGMRRSYETVISVMTHALNKPGIGASCISAECCTENYNR